MLEVIVPTWVMPLTLGSRPLVVVADDSPVVLKTVTLVLERMGLQVVGAANGAAAVEAARCHGPRVSAMLLDLMMPLLDGVEVARAVRAHYPDLPIVMMSGLGVLAITERLGALTITAALAKPFRIDTLRDAMQRALVRPAKLADECR
jgi:CheY-like chemotaxis protein